MKQIDYKKAAVSNTMVYRRDRVASHKMYPANSAIMKTHKPLHIAILALLTLSILASAFGLIYLKDYNRRLFIHFQKLQNTAQQYQVTKGKLLLEQSTWSTQARVQKIAQQRLGMVAPKSNTNIIVE